MDPFVALFTENGKFGIALFVAWKVVMRLLAMWKETANANSERELKRLDQQHDQHQMLTRSIDNLGVNVTELVEETRETNRHMERLIESQHLGRVARMG